MRVKIHKHNLIIKVHSIDEHSKVVTVKLFGTLCKFNQNEYEVVS